MTRPYQRLSPEVIDEIWVRLREGHAAKPTARQLGLSTGQCVPIWFVVVGSGRTLGDDEPGG